MQHLGGGPSASFSGGTRRAIPNPRSQRRGHQIAKAKLFSLPCRAASESDLTGGGSDALRVGPLTAGVASSEGKKTMHSSSTEHVRRDETAAGRQLDPLSPRGNTGWVRCFSREPFPWSRVFFFQNEHARIYSYIHTHVHICILPIQGL
jgi:hypothetical protein